MASSEEEFRKRNELLQAISVRDEVKVRKLLADPYLDINYWSLRERRSPLHAACCANLKSAVELLLKRKDLDINMPDRKGFTPFDCACLFGHQSIMRLLSEDPRLVLSPLHRACLFDKRDEILELLRDKKADVNRTTLGGISSLGLCVILNNLPAAELLLSCEEIQVDLPNNILKSPFFIACEQGNPKFVRRLASDPRVDVNQPDEFNQTPIFAAYFEPNMLVVQTILASPQLVDVGYLVHSLPLYEGHFFTNERTQKLRLPIAELVKEYQRCPNQVRLNLRRTLHREGSLLSIPLLLPTFA